MPDARYFTRKAERCRELLKVARVSGSYRAAAALGVGVRDGGSKRRPPGAAQTRRHLDATAPKATSARLSAPVPRADRIQQARIRFLARVRRAGSP